MEAKTQATHVEEEEEDDEELMLAKAIEESKRLQEEVERKRSEMQTPIVLPPTIQEP